MSVRAKKNLLIIFLLSPFCYMLYILILVGANDPIKYIFTTTGITAMLMLLTTTMLSTLKLTKYRKVFGLMSFFYALLHLFNFAIFDAMLDIKLIIKESIDKPFVYLGMIAFLLLLFMASTSTKKLFSKHNKKHKLIYIAILLVMAHFIIGQKVISIEYWYYFVIFIVVIFIKAKVLSKTILMPNSSKA